MWQIILPSKCDQNVIKICKVLMDFMKKVIFPNLDLSKKYLKFQSDFASKSKSDIHIEKLQMHYQRPFD